MRIDELERRSRTLRRTIRHYIDAGLLARPENHGFHTQYSDEHLLRLRVIKLLRVERGMTAGDVRAALKKMTHDEMLALVGDKPKVAPAPPAPPAPAPAGEGEAWERFTLLPGLELSVSVQASAVVKRLAAEIRGQYKTARA